MGGFVHARSFERLGNCRVHGQFTEVRESSDGFTGRREDGSLAVVPSTLLRVSGQLRQRFDVFRPRSIANGHRG